MNPALQALIHDLFDAYELLSNQLLVANLDYELDDEEMFEIFSRLHDRYHALVPEDSNALPLDTPNVRETQRQRMERLKTT